MVKDHPLYDRFKSLLHGLIPPVPVMSFLPYPCTLD